MNPQLQTILHNLFTRVKALEDTKAKTLTDEDADKAFKEWEKTETFPISSVEHHGFINGFKWALKKAQDK